jgi:predicted RNA-binding Zn-ribbon protein involved in translation (DUF1610 family)
MPRFACPHCGGVCTVSEESTGKKVRCPGCDRAFLADDDEPAEEDRRPRRDRASLADDDDEPAEEDLEPRRDGVGFRCPFCGTDEWPDVDSKVSTGGWVLFVGLLIFCFPLCFLGLLVKEEYRACSSCGVKLG